MLFVGFYSMPNLIVILFNLLYPVFIVGFDCNGLYVRERVCEDLSNWSQKSSRGYLATKLPAKWSMCLAHDWNAKSQYRIETIVSRKYLTGKAFPWDTRETFCSTNLYYQIHTFYTHTIYTHNTHKWWWELLRENPNNNTWELEIGITIIIHVYHVLIIGSVFYTLCPISAYSCISHASLMHWSCISHAH